MKTTKMCITAAFTTAVLTLGIIASAGAFEKRPLKTEIVCQDQDGDQWNEYYLLKDQVSKSAFSYVLVIYTHDADDDSVKVSQSMSMTRSSDRSMRLSFFDKDHNRVIGIDPFTLTGEAGPNTASTGHVTIDNESTTVDCFKVK